MSKSLLDSLSEYESYVDTRVADNTRSLIKKHILPGLVPSLVRGKSTQKLTPVLEKVPVAGFIEQANPILQAKLLEIENSGTRKVIKSQWNRFGTWLQEQDWYCSEPMAPETPGEASPQYTHFERIPVPKEKGKTPIRGLQKSELTPHLEQQFREFNLSKGKIRDVSVGGYGSWIRQFLRWRRDVQNISAQDLDITEMTDLTILKEYRDWLQGRDLSFNTVKGYLRAAPAIQVWALNQKTQGVDFRHPEIRKIWGFVNATRDDGRRPRVSDQAYRKRELTLDQCNDVLRYLRWRCKDLETQQGLTAEVVDAWMDYLIIAVLITTGVRQREVRELCSGRLNLSEGLYSVKLNPEDHKTGSKSDEGRGSPLFVGPLQKELSEDLAHYINHIRPKNLEHDCLFFTRQNTTYKGKVSLRGSPISGSAYLSQLVPELLYRVTAHLFDKEEAKATQCHDFRRITATWVCTYGKPEHLPLYAEMLGMSVEVLSKIYARLHPGVLAAQVPFAYKEIAENAARVTGKDLLGKPGYSSPKSSSKSNSFNGSNNQEHLLIKLLWESMSKRRQEKLLETVPPDLHPFLEPFIA